VFILPTKTRRDVYEAAKTYPDWFKAIRKEGVLLQKIDINMLQLVYELIDEAWVRGYDYANGR
jgi:hypothetical protein